MKKMLIVITFLALTLIGCGQSQPETSSQAGPQSEADLGLKQGDIMKITSPTFNHNEFIPTKYTCDGENISPPLAISEVPEGAQSLALISDDPDAPNGDWVHWLVWNIDPATQVIEENGLPQGATEGKTSFGKPGYGGPCPPKDTHRYFFKLYALDIKLELGPDADKIQLEQAMQGHVLQETVLMGKYSRTQ